MLDVLYYPVSAVMWVWHTLFALVLGPSSGARPGRCRSCSSVLTLRALMIKPFLVQMRSARAMRALTPQLTELRKRHGDDRRKLAEETQKLQRAHGVNPLGALAPALIQVPVFLALLHVLRYFNRPGLTFEQNAAIPNYVFGPAQVRSFLEARLFGAPLSAYVRMPQELLDSFGGHVDRIDVVAVAVPLMVLAAVATHLTARASLRQQASGARSSGGGRRLGRDGHAVHAPDAVDLPAGRAAGRARGRVPGRDPAVLADQQPVDAGAAARRLPPARRRGGRQAGGRGRAGARRPAEPAPGPELRPGAQARRRAAPVPPQPDAGRRAPRRGPAARRRPGGAATARRGGR